jgi:segregation and condensation protein B
MSLKAKLEAVVYAAEEPVTLAQLAARFAEEVLQGLKDEPSPVEEQIALAGLALEPATPEPEAPLPEETSAQEPLAGEPPVAPVEAVEDNEKKLARQRDRRVRQVLQPVLDELIADYAHGDRGMEIREIAGGYRMATKPEYHDAVRGFVKSLKPPMKLSLQALETLAVIAYKQPVTAPEVSEIRGVDSSGVLGSLVSRKLITTAGRKPVIGRPILYKTTKEFLLRFGLKDVNDLPSMEEFEKMAGELAESEAEGEAQDVVNLSPATPSSDAPASEEGGAPADAVQASVQDAIEDAVQDAVMETVPEEAAASLPEAESASEATEQPEASEPQAVVAGKP